MIWRIVLLSALCFSLPESSGAQSPAPNATPIVIQLPSQERDNVEYLLAVVQLITLICLIIYVIKTWEIASGTRRAAEATKKSAEVSQEVLKEMRATRNQEVAPYVIAYLDVPYGNTWQIFLVVKNTGKSVAKDIKLNFEPKLMSGFGNVAHEFKIPLVEDGISSLAPNQEIRVPLDVMSSYFGKMAEQLVPRLPTAYKVQVSYSGGLETDRIISEQVIDLSMYDEIGFFEEKESSTSKALNSSASSLSRMERHFRNIAETLINGIRLKNSGFMFRVIHKNTEDWRLTSVATLEEFRLLWKESYAGNYQRPLPLYLEDLQAQISILSSQILFIAANAPTSVDADIVHSLVEISKNLSVLSEVRWLMNGEISDPDFTSTGQEAMKLIENVIEKIGISAQEKI